MGWPWSGGSNTFVDPFVSLDDSTMKKKTYGKKKFSMQR